MQKVCKLSVKQFFFSLSSNVVGFVVEALSASFVIHGNPLYIGPENPGDSRSDELHLSSVFVFTCHYALNNSQSVAVECKHVGQTAIKRVKWRRPLVFISDQTENRRHSSCSE